MCYVVIQGGDYVMHLCYYITSYKYKVSMVSFHAYCVSMLYDYILIPEGRCVVEPLSCSGTTSFLHDRDVMYECFELCNMQL